MSAETEKKAAVGTESDNGKVATAAQLLEAAPKDLITETLFIEEWDLNIRVQSLTAAQSARIRQHGIGFRDNETKVAWAEMEVLQFQEGVIDPSLKREQVQQLYRTSGPGFQRVINWLDENSGINKEELRKARDEFQGPKD